MRKARRNGGARSRKRGKGVNGRAQRSRPRGVEPSSFAWIEPLDDLDQLIVEKIVEKEVIVEKPVLVEKIVEKPARVHGGKTIIIGRGPSLAERLARAAPDPKPVLAGACALIIALAGVALISPRGERATAARSTAPLGVADGASGGATSNYGLVTGGSAAVPHGAARDPFAAKNFKPRPPATAKAAGRRATGKRAAGKNARGREPNAATPATARPSLFVADFITYSSYTPWIKIKRRSGGWIDFGGKPTVKVVSVGDKTVELFVVTDVEVLADRSRAIDYSDPIRIVKLKPGAVVRFADYRDVQGEDVEYTIRFRGSLPINLTLPG